MDAWLLPLGGDGRSRRGRGAPTGSAQFRNRRDGGRARSLYSIGWWVEAVSLVPKHAAAPTRSSLRSAVDALVRTHAANQDRSIWGPDSNRMSLQNGTRPIAVSETGELPSVSAQDARDGRENLSLVDLVRNAKEKLKSKAGGEGGIRTHVPLTGQDAFEAPPLRPLRYLSGRACCQASGGSRTPRTSVRLKPDPDVRSKLPAAARGHYTARGFCGGTSSPRSACRFSRKNC